MTDDRHSRPRWTHWHPTMQGDKFLFQCGDIDVWHMVFKQGPLDQKGELSVVLRHDDFDPDAQRVTYVVCSTLKKLEALAADYERYLPLLARAKLTGKWP